VYVYRRRRAVALVVLAGLVAAIGILALQGGAAPQLTPAEQLRRERADDPVRLTVEASGDLLIHSPVWTRALANGGGSTYDFRPMLEPIKPYIEGADLALCHIETPLGPGEPQTYPLFKAPPELADAVAATGWDACDTASNHSLDQHMSGIRQTGEALDAAGVKHTGSFTSQAARDTPLILNAKGVKIGFIAYADYTNGIPLPRPYAENVAARGEVGEVERVIADARAARNAGAEAVIVNMHWGTENSSKPNESQVAQAQALTASPLITAVVGQGPHVVQPIEWINGKPVVFSEGNLISNEDANCCPAASEDGMIVLLDLVVDGQGAHVDRVRYVPVWVDHSDYLVLPVGEALEAGDADPTSLKDSYDRTVSVAGEGDGVEPVPPILK
jgi:hypothetical protein